MDKKAFPGKAAVRPELKHQTEEFDFGEKVPALPETIKMELEDRQSPF
jgi:hypothetical protein